MMAAMDAASVLAWIREAIRVYSEHKDYLTELDAAIGDGDHGINIHRGYTAVAGAIPPEPGAPGSEFADIAGIFKSVALLLIRTVGGASGPLYGTFFLRASTAAANRLTLDTAAFAAVFAAGVVGMVERGKARVGDKTMLDALLPARDALIRATTEGIELPHALVLAAAAGKEGMHSTIALQAKKGRASYLGERSIGHQDPGATSAYLLLQAAADTMAGRSSCNP